MTDWKKALEETERVPLFEPGTHECTVEAIERTTNPIERRDTLHLKFSTPDGPRAVLLVCSGKSEAISMAKFMRFIMAAAGYRSPEEYEAFDPNFELPDAMLGASNSFAKRGITVIGRPVVAHVTRGKPTKDGADFYRDVVFEAAAE